MDCMRKTTTTRFPKPPTNRHAQISSQAHSLLRGKLLIGRREKQAIKKSISLNEENAKLLVDWKKIKDFAEIVFERTRNKDAFRTVLRFALRVEWHELLKKQSIVHRRAAKAASTIRGIYSRLAPEEQEKVSDVLGKLVELEEKEREFHDFIEERLIRILMDELNARDIRNEVFQGHVLNAKERIDREIQSFYNALSRLMSQTGRQKRVLQFCKALREEHQTKVSLFFGVERLMRILSDLDSLATNNPPKFI